MTEKSCRREDGRLLHGHFSAPIARTRKFSL
jgi:hypothetical protein